MHLNNFNFDFSTSCTMHFLEVNRIRKQEGNNVLVNDVSFSLQQFEKLAIAGSTGSGKSTVLKIIAGLVQASEGTVLFENIRVEGPQEKLMSGHPEIAYVSQQFELRNHYRVVELIDMANKISDSAAQEISELCRIDGLLNRWSHQLSGGEKQRVALAIQLLAAPKLLLLDEPYSNLDFTHKNILMAVINDIATKTAITCVLVSHDPTDTLSWADRILVLQGGTVLQHATPEEIYYRPVNSYVAGLFGKYNLLTPEMTLQFAGNGGGQQLLANSIIRPNQFVMQTKSQGVKGAVVDVRFMCAYTQLIVQIEDQYLVVNTFEDFKVGDAVYLAVKPINWHFKNSI